MTDTFINVIDLACNIRDFVTHSKVDFDPVALRDVVFSAHDDDFLRIKKRIGSDTTITSVTKIDDDFIKNAVLGR